MLKDISNGKSHDQFTLEDAMTGDVNTASTKIALKYLNLYTQGLCSGNFEIFTKAAWYFCIESAIEICMVTSNDDTYSLATRCDAALTAMNLQYHPYFNEHVDLSFMNALLVESTSDYNAMLGQVELALLCLSDTFL